MATIALDVLDAIELAEILEFLIQHLDDLGITTLPACDPNIYNVNSLRADINRLINHLHTNPTTP